MFTRRYYLMLHRQREHGLLYKPVYDPEASFLVKLIIFKRFLNTRHHLQTMLRSHELHSCLFFTSDANFSMLVWVLLEAS